MQLRIVKRRPDQNDVCLLSTRAEMNSSYLILYCGKKYVLISCHDSQAEKVNIWDHTIME